MLIQVYSSLSLYILLSICCPIHSYSPTMSEEHIYKNLHTRQKLCGPVLSDTMRDLCVEYNGIRARRSITECCKDGCSFFYLMTYFCKVARIKLDDLSGWMLSSTAESERTKDSITAERLAQNSKSTEFGQEPIPNKIQKQHASEEINNKPAEYGYVRSTRPTIIYGHSNSISPGFMRYQIPNQNNSNHQ